MYSAELIRFITGVPVLNDGTIPINTIASNANFVSKLYTPTYALSTVARLVQPDLNNGTIETIDLALGKETLVYKALQSDLASYAPDIYLLLRSVVLESFAILHTVDNSPVNLQYMSSKDIIRIRTNINYLADYMGTEEKYFYIIEDLRNLNISFGYVENQIDVIRSDRGVK
jgi:hypothetical protein